MFGLTEEDIKTLKNIFKAHTEIEEVIIFGSRATNTFKRGSDVDLALKGNINRQLVDTISGELEDTILPYFFDVLDFSSIKEETLKANIRKYGEVFYKQNQLKQGKIGGR